MMKKLVLLALFIALPIALLAMADNYFSVRSSAYLEQAIQKKLTDVVTNALIEPTQKYMSHQRLVTYIKDEDYYYLNHYSPRLVPISLFGYCLLVHIKVIFVRKVSH